MEEHEQFGFAHRFDIRKTSFLPRTAFTAGHVTAFTTAATQSVDFPRFKVRTGSPVLIVDWLMSVMQAILP